MANNTNSTGIILRTIHREWCERRARWRSQQLVIITTVFRTGSRKPLGEIIIPNEVIVREASLIVVKESVNPWGSLLTTWNWRRARRLHPFMAHWWRGASPLHPYLMARGLGWRANKLNPILVNAMTAPWRGASTFHPCLISGMDLRGRPLPRVPTRTAVSRRWVTGRENLTTRLVTGPRGLAGRGGRGFLVLLLRRFMAACLFLSSASHILDVQSAQKWHLDSLVHPGAPPYMQDWHFSWLSSSLRKWEHLGKVRCSLRSCPCGSDISTSESEFYTHTVNTTNMRAQA